MMSMGTIMDALPLGENADPTFAAKCITCFSSLLVRLWGNLPKVPKKPRFMLQVLRLTGGVHVIEVASKVRRALSDVTCDFAMEDVRKATVLAARVNHVAAAAQSFLEGPIITDRFTDHLRRRAWRSVMRRWYGEAFDVLYESNKLRNNKLSAVWMAFDALVHYLDKFEVTSPGAESIRAMSKRLPELGEYNQLPDGEKIAIARAYERICEEFLVTFASQ